MGKSEQGIFLNRDRYLLYALAGSLLLCLGPALLDPYWLKFLSFLIVSLVIACSWNLIGGYCGYFSFGHGLFFGVGAYTIAVAFLRFNVNPYVGMLLGGLVSAALAIVMSPMLRLKGFNFALTTLALLEATQVIFRKWEFTRGMKSWDLGWSFPPLATDTRFYFLLVLVFFLMLVSHIVFLSSRIGVAATALKEDELMARGAGVILQRYKDGGLSDVKVFRLAEGLTWRLGERTRTETDLREWLGDRAQAGRMPPNGFPRGLKF